ncbi:MAG TPA: GAF domain-containing protein, partial [Microlunatus sp.]|nr:GAF domain-containing protein [Microlunatus sp.]
SSASVRWPAFRRAAARAGVRAVYAFPLRFRAVRIGTLLLYRTAPGRLDSDALRQARRVADAIGAAVVTQNATSGEDHDS